MTGKEFRKGLKKLFKEKGIDDLNICIIGDDFTFLTLYVMTDDRKIGDTKYQISGGGHFGDDPDEFYLKKIEKTKI